MSRRRSLRGGVAAGLLAACGLAGLLSAATGPGSAGEIPAHPDRLRFSEQRFELPPVDGLRHRLANGVPVYVVEDPTVPLVDVTLAMRVGDYLDPPDRVGLASLTGLMIRRGGAGERSAEELDEEADFLAAEIESLTGATRAGVRLNCSSAVLEEALGLWADVLLAPRFQEDRLASAKANLLTSFERRNDDPLDLLGREWRRLLYGPGHFRARQATPADLDRVGRAELIEFHRRHWRPDSAVIAVAGDVETEELLALLDRLLAGWRPRQDAPPPRPPVEIRPVEPGLYHAEHPTPQAKIYLGAPTARRSGWDDPDELPLLVAAEILGGGGTISRLRSRLRAEEALVYRASASAGLGDRQPGELQLFLEAEPGALARAVELALGEVRRLRREPVRQVELDLAKKGLIDSFPLLFDGGERLAGRLAEDDLLGRPTDYWRTYRRRIAAVGPDEVRRAAEKYLRPERLIALVVGPWPAISGGAERSDLERALGTRVRHLPARDPLTLEPRSP